MKSEELLNKILKTAKEAYKTSISQNYNEVQDLLLNQITDITILKEYLNNEIDTTCTLNKTRTFSSRENIDNKEAVNKVAYFLSRFEHTDLFNCSQTEAMDKISILLNIKKTSLRNIRDSFDPYVNELKEKHLVKRKGWWHVELLPDYKKIYDYYENKSKEEILSEVKNILNL